MPAMVWHNIMAYAHQGVELRPLPGLPPPQHAPTVAEATFKGGDAPQQILLTRKGTEALVHVERLLDDADHALAAQAAPAGTLGALDGGKSRRGRRRRGGGPAVSRLSRGD